MKEFKNRMNGTKVQNSRRYGGVASFPGLHAQLLSLAGAPIIDGLGHAPPHPRAARLAS